MVLLKQELEIARILNRIKTYPQVQNRMIRNEDAILTDMFYGGDRLAACLSKNASLSASALCQAIVEDLAQFSGSTQTHDDQGFNCYKTRRIKHDGHAV